MVDYTPPITDQSFILRHIIGIEELQSLPGRQRLMAIWLVLYWKPANYHVMCLHRLTGPATKTAQHWIRTIM